MKNLSKYIESIPPSQLSKLRATRLNDSTRDKKRLVEFVQKLERDLGGLIVVSKAEYLNILLKDNRIVFGIYELFSVSTGGDLSFMNTKTAKTFHVKCEALLDKIIDFLQGKRFNILTFKYFPDDDIIELIEDKDNWLSE